MINYLSNKLVRVINEVQSMIKETKILIRCLKRAIILSRRIEKEIILLKTMNLDIAIDVIQEDVIITDPKLLDES